MTKRIFLTLLVAAFALSACGGNATPDPALDPVLAMTAAFATINASSTQTALAVPTLPPAPTETPVPPAPPPFNPTVIMQITVAVPVVNCRFGPDTIYVAPYGLRFGKIREAIGRDETGAWLLVREIEGKKACWVSAPTVTVQGDPSTLAIAPTKLSFTDKYGPPPYINATRNGDQVQVSWGDVPLTKEDVFIDSHYLLETWLCSNGQFLHKLTATNDLSLVLTDDASCAESSHAQIYTATRSGYSNPAKIPWPQH
jgi:hypothetical protein